MTCVKLKWVTVPNARLDINAVITIMSWIECAVMSGLSGPIISLSACRSFLAEVGADVADLQALNG